MRTELWGTVDYETAVHQQLQLVEDVAENRADDTLVVCDHPPVVTLGRGVKPGDVFGWTGSVVETTRGGRATYHGPGQIVVYPILNLNRARKTMPARDLHAYLRNLEIAIVNTLRELSIPAEARTIKLSADEPSLTGVWVGEQKLASIGIAVKKWVTYHGLALNVKNDPLAFQGINPCGFQSQMMTSMEAVLDRDVSKQDVQDLLLANLTDLFRDPI